MENLAINQHQNTSPYAIIWGGDYRPWIHGSEILGDFIYMQQTTLITLDVITRCGILHAWKVLPFWCVIVGRLRWSNMEGLHVIVYHVIFLMWITKLSILNNCPCKSLLMCVVSLQELLYVDLWLVY